MIIESINNKTINFDNATRDVLHRQDREGFNPTIFFSSSPQVSKLTLEAQGVLLYDSQK